MRVNLTHRAGRLLAVTALMATAITGAITASAPPAFASGFGQVTPGQTASDIGVGGGKVWMIDRTPVGSFGNQVFRWNGSGWDPIVQPNGVPAAGTAIDVDPQGKAWLVNLQGSIFHYDGSKFVGVTGPSVPAGTRGGATDIGVGADGSVWITGRDDPNPNHYGSTVYRLVGNSWTKTTGLATNLDVDPNGNAWVTNLDHNLFRWDTTVNKFVPVTVAGVQTQARDVGIGSQGDLWITQWTPNEGVHGYPVLRWTGSGWNQVPNAAAEEISSGPNRDPWVVNKTFDIYHCSTDCA